MSFEITIPRLGWSMEEGIFAGWLKKDGDVIRRGDALFELEGEKALQEVEALDDGVLRLMADGPQLGTVLKVGAVVGYLVADGAALAQTPSDSNVASNAIKPVEKAPAMDINSMSTGGSPSVRRRRLAGAWHGCPARRARRGRAWLPR